MARQGRGDIFKEEKKKPKQVEAPLPVPAAESSVGVRREQSTTSVRVRRDSVFAGKVRSYFNSHYNLGLFTPVWVPGETVYKAAIFSHLSYREAVRTGDNPTLEVYVYPPSDESLKYSRNPLPESFNFGGKEISLDYIVLEKK